MITVSTIDYTSPSPCVVALGCFDGVHRGHEAVIRRARTIADEQSLPLAVWSFRTPPKNYFSPNAAPLITTVEEKENLLRSLGANIVLSVPFDEAIASMPYEEFFETILCERLCAKHIICGYDFTFGAGGRGNPERLKALCDGRGIALSIVPALVIGGEAVSSSRIREAIEAGNTAATQDLLGRAYAITAEVVHGQHLARDLGFRTINQLLPEGKAVPKYGVYVVQVAVDGASYYGIANVGMRPTVGGTILCAETHVFDFSGDLYGKTVAVSFLHFLRPETRFSSLETLTAQIARDVSTAQEWLKNSK